MNVKITRSSKKITRRGTSGLQLLKKYASLLQRYLVRVRGSAATGFSAKISRFAKKFTRFEKNH